MRSTSPGFGGDQEETLVREGGGEWETLGEEKQGMKLWGCAEGFVKGPSGNLRETGKETKWSKKSHFSSPFSVMSVLKRLLQLHLKHPSRVRKSRLWIV